MKFTKKYAIYWRRLKEEGFSPKFLFSRIILKNRIALRTKIQIAMVKGQPVSVLLQPTALTHSLWLGKYDTEVDIAVLNYFVDSGFTVVDVGANIGMHALISAKLADAGRVFAFEPNAKSYNALIQNIRYGESDNVTAFNMAITETNGVFDFVEYIFADEQSSLRDLKGFRSKNVKVPGIRLESFIDLFDIKKIDFLKIDTEGAEWFVCKSLGEKISEVSVIYFEYLETHFRGFGHSGEDILSWFREKGFKVYEPKINEGKLELEPILATEQISSGNLLAINTLKTKK